LANARLYPPLLRFLIRSYVRFFKIDLSEYEFEYKKVTTFNAFFTRKLKPGMRAWDEGICSPVDGTLLSHGALENDLLFQVKGMAFSMEELVGESGYHQGSFANLYLSPGDYHRIHAPFDFKLEMIRHIPGRLLSVSSKNAASVRDLYNKNERLILKGTSNYGNCFLVFVGALNVGSIRLTHFPAFKTNIAEATTRALNVSLDIKKGEEIGWFELGSTVLIIVDGNELSESEDVHYLQKIKLGNRLV
jgi:phosphatidylserine decarboxylase